MRRKDSPEEKSGFPPKARDEAETAKGRPAAQERAPSEARDEAETAKGRPAAQERAPSEARDEAETAKGRPANRKSRKGYVAGKRIVSGRGSRPAVDTGRADPAGAGDPSFGFLDRDAGMDLPLGPEAMPRIRRSLDRPAAPKIRSRPAPRDRSSPIKEGLQELGWQGVAEASRDLARQIARRFSPDFVVGVAKGGVFPGQEIATALGCPFFAMRIHRRSRDHGSPDSYDTMPGEVRGHRLLIVDDIAGTGATLEAASEAAREAGTLEVRTATLVVREGGFRPDYFGIETGDLVVFPWDYDPSPGAVGTHDGDPEDFGV